jgi:hypothetical protein
MRNLIRNFVVFVVSFVLAVVISVAVHEGGHAAFAEIFGGDTTRVKMFWWNISRTEDTSGEYGTWEWGTNEWVIGKDIFGKMWYVPPSPTEDFTDTEYGWINLMGSGSTLILAAVLLVVLYLRKHPSRFPWLTTFIILAGIVDMFTYTVIPMIGEYVTLEKPEARYQVACSNHDLKEYFVVLLDEISPPASDFDPQVRMVDVACGKLYDEMNAVVLMLVEFEKYPDPERLTRMFLHVETPEDTRWLVSNEFERYEVDGEAAYIFLYRLPPIPGKYEVNQAFLVNNGLRRLIFFYGKLWDDGLVLVEPLYGAVRLNINPYLFIGIVTLVTVVMSFFFLGYVLIYRGETWSDRGFT